MQNLPGSSSSGSVGILVFGDNHLIVSGPRPNRQQATALMRHWSIIRIGATTPEALADWSIRTSEFRERLDWAVIVPGAGRQNPAVTQLLAELTARGVRIDDYSA